MFALEPRKDSEQQCYKCDNTHKYHGADKTDLYLVNKLIKTDNDASKDQRKGIHIQVFVPYCHNCDSYRINLLIISISIACIIGIVLYIALQHKLGFMLGCIAGIVYYKLRSNLGKSSGKINDHPIIRELYKHGFRNIEEARIAEPRYYSSTKIGNIFKTIIEKYGYVLKDVDNEIEYSFGSSDNVGSAMNMAAWNMGDLAGIPDLDLDMDLDADFDADFDGDFDFDGGD